MCAYIIVYTYTYISSPNERKARISHWGAHLGGREGSKHWRGEEEEEEEEEEEDDDDDNDRDGNHYQPRRSMSES